MMNTDDPHTPTLVDLPPLPPELQKYRNSLVLLSNVPGKASREDILEIIKSFSPLENTLKIRHDDMGNPTGDAIVACRTPEDANRACRSLNGIDFMGKNIKAALVSP
jgi:RNA recognition motif-containing protein